jgi:hypothetical protein
MKQIKSTLLILTLCALVFSSCKKSSTNPTFSTSISFKINGTAKSSTNLTAVYDHTQNTLQVISAFSAESVTLVIENVKTGAFDVSTGGALVAYSNSSDSFTGSVGNVTITSFTNDTVTGTFQFTGTGAISSSNTAVVTEGKFQAKYIKQ